MGNDITYLTGCGKDWVKIYVMWLDYWNIIRTIQVFAIIISSTTKKFYSMCYKYVASHFAGEQWKNQWVAGNLVKYEIARSQILYDFEVFGEKFGF